MKNEGNMEDMISSVNIGKQTDNLKSASET